MAMIHASIGQRGLKTVLGQVHRTSTKLVQVFMEETFGAVLLKKRQRPSSTPRSEEWDKGCSLVWDFLYESPTGQSARMRARFFADGEVVVELSGEFFDADRLPRWWREWTEFDWQGSPSATDPSSLRRDPEAEKHEPLRQLLHA